jgi:UDP-GlcNAc:undecaprenyl-phosphate GlcNAc-1-phosphate transferase
MNTELYLILITFISSALLLYLYKKLSYKLNILDIPNYLSVHSKKTPTGAGIVFFIIFSLLYLLSATDLMKDFDLFHNQKNYKILFISLSILSVMSFYDDIKNVHPVIRLFFQCTIIFFCTSLFDYSTINNIPLKLCIFATIYFWVYTINIINFTDGVDGFLAINAITFFSSTFLYFYLIESKIFLYYLSLIMLPILFSYLFFNRPKALLFMGDSGSIFIGFLIGFVSIQLIFLGRYDIVITLLSYTYIDCTMTIIKKIFNKQYPWARLFDYYFLIPIKNNFPHKKVFFANIVYNSCIMAIVAIQIIYNIKLLFILSLFLATCLIFYFNSFSRTARS